MEKKEEILINEPEMVSEKPSKVKFILAILASTLILASVTTLLIGHLKFDWFKSDNYKIDAHINRNIYQANYFSEKKTLNTKFTLPDGVTQQKRIYH
jgi:DNA topoisomerase IA